MIQSRKIPYYRKRYELVEDPAIIYQAKRNIQFNEFLAKQMNLSGKRAGYEVHMKKAQAIRNHILEKYGILID